MHATTETGALLKAGEAPLQDVALPMNRIYIEWELIM